MLVSAYYNEHDEFAAQWLRNLIAEKHIAPGDVDTRDLWDVKPDDIENYTQVHLCAGVGIWSLALRNAGWSDSRPVWTASFPCQPLSAAGKGLGEHDPRHLWPCGLHLIRECRPPVILGEQVASPLGLRWLEGVQADLQAEDYAVGAVDTCAAGFADEAGNEGFHIRQRLYWGARRLGNAHHQGPQGRSIGRNGADQRAAGPSGMAGEARRLGHTQGDGRLGRQDDGDTGRGQRPPGQAGEADGLEHTASDGRLERGAESGGRGAEPRRGDGGMADSSERTGQFSEPQSGERTIPQGDDGRNAGIDWLYCRDGKYRPTKPGLFPLANAYPNRVGVLRAAGNALDAAQARGFVEAWLDCCPD